MALIACSNGRSVDVWISSSTMQKMHRLLHRLMSRTMSRFGNAMNAEESGCGSIGSIFTAQPSHHDSPARRQFNWHTRLKLDLAVGHAGEVRPVIRAERAGNHREIR